MANKKETNNKHEFKIKVKEDRWVKEIDKAFSEVVKNVKIDGFRKGKVTREIFDKKIGKQEYLQEAANHIIQEEYIRLLTENKDLRIIGNPIIDFVKFDDKEFEFTITLIEEPKAVVKKYKGLNIKPEKVTVKKEEIDHEIGHILERFSELVIKEKGKVENGNVAVIDFEGFKDGVSFDGGKGENYPLEIGSNTFIPGFEEQIIGMKKDEEKDINVVFPEEYQAEDLAGKPVVFKVKVNEIKEKETRKLDKELFEDLGIDGVDSEEKLREFLKKQINDAKTRESENKYVKELLDAIVKNTECDVPDEMIHDTCHMMFDDFCHNLEHQGINFKMYEQYTGQTKENIMESMKDEAKNRILTRLALDYIKETEKIDLTEKEVDKKIKELVDTYKVTEEEILKEFGSKEAMKYDFVMNKVLDFLKEENK